MTQQIQLIILTDLDGTLLDHHSYSWQAACPALQMLRERGIPLILCTSKTAAEVSKLHQELELNTPYIVENGAGIILDSCQQSAHFFGTPYPKLVKQLQSLRQQRGYHFTGFNDYSVAAVAAATGLDSTRAALAKQRLCSEPIRWEDSDDSLLEFQTEIAKLDLQLLRGGRFYHVLSIEADKGKALRWLLEHYRSSAPSTRWRSIALGDGPNDQAMLEAADIAVVIPSLSGLSPKPKDTTVIYASEPGPVGWNQTILDILKEQTNG